ncbi:hypothetical protein FIBSPDRAFT_903349 [Athelia psychrophila]|uniref:Uncharacterized protein n=1 Tax=Athelia psychrophila TaxID=1759441 RepID=A0A167W3T8_9AGAM|nr:hypothetical protein FIBSPDRAFT_903349 [Fibularhizoctonia sp. CBS 109695]
MIVWFGEIREIRETGGNISSKMMAFEIIDELILFLLSQRSTIHPPAKGDVPDLCVAVGDKESYKALERTDATDQGPPGSSRILLLIRPRLQRVVVARRKGAPDGADARQEDDDGVLRAMQDEDIAVNKMSNYGTWILSYWLMTFPIVERYGSDMAVATGGEDEEAGKRSRDGSGGEKGRQMSERRDDMRGVGTHRMCSARDAHTHIPLAQV